MERMPHTRDLVDAQVNNGIDILFGALTGGLVTDQPPRVAFAPELRPVEEVYVAPVVDIQALQASHLGAAAMTDLRRVHQRPDLQFAA